MDLHSAPSLVDSGVLQQWRRQKWVHKISRNEVWLLGSWAALMHTWACAGDEAAAEARRVLTQEMSQSC